MIRRHAVIVALAAALVASIARGTLAAQALPVRLTNTVTLKTFTPIDSFFVNPTQTDFPVTLVNTISGGATEYRVSRFPDFRDGVWRPYDPRPQLVVPGSWFQSTSQLGVREVTLHFQVRNKNPNAGRPISLVDHTVQPDFFFSEVIAKRLRIVFAG